jgi:hypothetical protein
MKGTIVVCLRELVVTQFGQQQWDKSLRDAGFGTDTMFLAIADIDDSQVVRLIEAVCKNLGISLAQAADAFGDYWVNVYSQRLYPHYYRRHTTARDFLLNMDNLHVDMTAQIPNAKPPRFQYEWKDAQTLIIQYRSHRGLVDFVVGLVKGVGKHYKEALKVSKVGPDRVQVVFA